MVDSISQQLAENARRIRERQRPNIGGAYGAGQFIHQGHRPSRQIVFFDDGVRIQDSLNRYNGSVWSVFTNTKFDGGPETFSRVEAFLKLAQPVEEIASIVINLDDFIYNWSISVKSGEDISQSIWRAKLGLNLIKTPLDLGETFGLDKLTFPNSNWTNPAAVHGDLYQTPANFDDFGGIGAMIFNMNTLNDTASQQTGAYTFQSNGTDGGAGSEIRILKTGVDFVGVVGDFALKTTGPYFGVHLFWQPDFFGPVDHLVQGSPAAIILPDEAGEFYDISADTPNQRTGLSKALNRRRSYILTDNDYRR